MSDNPMREAAWMKRIQAGDDEVLEEIFGALVAPLFDWAYFEFGDPDAACIAVIRELRQLALKRLDLPPSLDGWFAKAAVGISRSNPREPAVVGITSLRELVLPTPDLRLLLFDLLFELSASTLATTLEASATSIAETMDRLKKQRQIQPQRLIEELDSVAAKVALPPGLIDQALHDEP